MEQAGVGSHISPYQKQIRNWRKGQNTCMREDKSSGNEEYKGTQNIVQYVSALLLFMHHTIYASVFACILSVQIKVKTQHIFLNYILHQLYSTIVTLYSILYQLYYTISYTNYTQLVLPYLYIGTVCITIQYLNTAHNEHCYNIVVVMVLEVFHSP